MMKKIAYNKIQSPVGELVLLADEEGLCGLYFADGFSTCHEGQDEIRLQRAEDHPVLIQARRQLESYFAGRLQVFDLPLHLPQGTDFQKQVWLALAKVPYGSTVSYGQLAAMIGRPKACRAVGQANHVNPISIILPCHRVIGANGSLTGYGGGLERKQWLLGLEQRR